MAELIPLRMPSMGNGVESAVVSEWLIDVGERVEAGDTVATIETDKAEAELEAPVAGTLAAVHVEDGAEVAVGDLLAEFAGE